jgi:hypothetical protein
VSIEIYVLLEKKRIPDRASLQEMVESLALPLELDPSLDLMKAKGFSPCKIKGISSGCEIYSESPQDLLATHHALQKAIGARDWCISFRWGGDMKECACAMAVSAAIVKLCDAVAYDPEDDQTCDLKSLLQDAQACLNEF